MAKAKKRRLPIYSDHPAGKPEVAEKIDLEALEKLAGIGMGVKSIASYMGVGKRTLDRYIAERDDVREAFERGSAKGQGRALKNLAVAMDKGNVMAIIFYLVNKFPGEWQSVHKGATIVNANQTNTNTGVNIPVVPLDKLKQIRDILKDATNPDSGPSK